MKACKNIRIICAVLIAAVFVGVGYAAAPKVVQTIPANSEQDVNPSLRQIRIEFDQDMQQGGYSVCGGGPKLPEMVGKPRWVNKRTIVAGVRLRPNRQYEFSVNCQSYRNFRSVASESAEIYPVSFSTGAASAADVKSPRVLLQEGIYAEEIEGDLDGAMRIYEQVISQAEAAKATAAQAVYRLGMCYLKKGQKEKAADQFQKVLSKFPEQKAVAEKASEQLNRIRPPEERIVEQAVMTISTCAEGDPRVTKALESLRGINENAVVGELNKFLDSQPDTVRRSSIYILWKGDFNDISPAVGRLQELCSHKEDLTRGMAAIALGAAKAQSSFETLCSMTLNDSSGYARRSAAYALGLLGRPDAKPILEKALKDADKFVRDNASHAINMLQGEAPVVPAASFGPVIERVIYDPGSSGECFVDFESGRVYRKPEIEEDKILEWFREKGIDASGDTSGSPKSHGLVAFPPFHPAAIHAPLGWSASADVLIATTKHLTPSGKTKMFAKETLPTTYYFKTQQGNMGVLQILGFTEGEPKGIRIRYKMVQGNSYDEATALLVLLQKQTQSESLRKLNILGKALLVYANDQDTGSYPDTLRALEKDYTTKEYVEWSLENVEYMGKGETAAEPPNTVIAYDKKLLQGGNGTNVLFNDGHVRFLGPVELERLGIRMPEATTTEVRKVFLPNPDPANTSVVLDLASGEMLSAERFEKSRQYFKNLGKGDLLFGRKGKEGGLICLRDGYLLGESGEPLKSEEENSVMKAYVIREVPWRCQFVTAEGDKYEVKVLSMDKGDNGGCLIEYWKSGARAQQESAVKPIFRAVIYDNMALDLESGAVVALGNRRAATGAAVAGSVLIGGVAGQAACDVGWDNDGGGVLMVVPDSGARIVGLATIQQGQWPQATAAARGAIKVLKSSGARGVLAKQSRFAAVLTSEGNLAVIEITDFDAEKAKIEWRLEELPGAKASQQGFGPVMKEFIAEDSGAIDFDTGRMFTIPEIVKNNEEAAMQWVVDNGIDAGADQELIGVDLAGERMPARAWQEISAGELAAVARAGSAGKGQVIIPHSGEYPATYALRTREGGIGIVQILDVNNQGAKVQYKMLPRNMAAEAAAEVVDPNSVKKWQMGGLAELAEQARQEIAAKYNREGLEAMAKAMAGLGWELWENKEFTKAEDVFSKAVGNDPTNCSALKGLAMINMERKNYNKAIEYYHKWLDAEPNNADAKAGLEKAQKASAEDDKVREQDRPAVG